MLDTAVTLSQLSSVPWALRLSAGATHGWTPGPCPACQAWSSAPRAAGTAVGRGGWACPRAAPPPASHRLAAQASRTPVPRSSRQSRRRDGTEGRTHHGNGGVELPNAHSARRVLAVEALVRDGAAVGHFHCWLRRVRVQVDELLT